MADGNDQRVTFIVRLTRKPNGRIAGVVERVRTGQKSQVGAIEEVTAILAEMLAVVDRSDV